MRIHSYENKVIMLQELRGKNIRIVIKVEEQSHSITRIKSQ